jgi:hypothetical protein
MSRSELTPSEVVEGELDRQLESFRFQSFWNPFDQEYGWRGVCTAPRISQVLNGKKAAIRDGPCACRDKRQWILLL